MKNCQIVLAAIFLAAFVSLGSASSASAMAFNAGDSVSYGFDFSTFGTFTPPAINYRVNMYLSGDIFDLNDTVGIVIRDSLSNVAYSTSINGNTFGDASPAFGLWLSNDTYMAAIYSSLKGSVTISMIEGSVNLTGVESIMRATGLRDFTITQFSEPPAPNPVPEPSTIWAFASGLAALACAGRMRRVKGERNR